MDSSPIQIERRRTQRFAIRRAVRIRTSSRRRADAQTASGHTINISSTGVLFTTDRDLVPGRRVELSISWPAQLDDACPLKLVASGRVVRAAPGCAAVEISRYEFRTAARQAFDG